MLCKQLQFCLAGEPAPAQRNIMPPVFDPINPGHNKAAAPLKTKTRAFMGDYPEIEEAARDINSSSQTWEDITKTALQLLEFHREEEQQTWDRTREILHRTAGQADDSFAEEAERAKGPLNPQATGVILGAGPPKKFPSEPRAPRPRQKEWRPHQGLKPEPKRDYTAMLKTQQTELGFQERMYNTYQKLVDQLLDEQVIIQQDINEHPWDLAVGVVRDPQERLLKRKLLWLIGACPADLDPSCFQQESSIQQQSIAKELDAIVKEVDANADGLLSDEELLQSVQDNPDMKFRLQTLRLNLALSPENKLRSNNKVRRAVLTQRMDKVREQADIDGNGYVDLEELMTIVKRKPELAQALKALGVPLIDIERKAQKARQEAMQ